jgi:hypothetical protein
VQSPSVSMESKISSCSHNMLLQSRVSLFGVYFAACSLQASPWSQEYLPVAITCSCSHVCHFLVCTLLRAVSKRLHGAKKIFLQPTSRVYRGTMSAFWITYDIVLCLFLLCGLVRLGCLVSWFVACRPGVFRF